MKTDTPLWMYQGAGKPPESVMSFRAESSVTALASMLECGDFVLADDLGTLYRLDPFLNVRYITRLESPVRKLAWDALGEFGAAFVEKKTLRGFNSRLKSLWSVELPFVCSALAVDPYGGYVFVASEDGRARLYDAFGKKKASLETQKPLAHAEFMIDEPVLIVSAKQGLLAAYDIKGKLIWQEHIWCNVSDLSILQRDQQICLAAQNHGIKVYDEQGDSVASLVLEGTACRISTSYTGRQIFAATLEHQLYRINDNGELLWAAKTPRGIPFLTAHPVAKSCVVAFDDGNLLRLEW